VREKLAVAKAESLATQNEVRRYGKKDDALTASVDRTVAAIEQANTSSQALGRTLTAGLVQ
jgi:hypothetical protein